MTLSSLGPARLRYAAHPSHFKTRPPPFFPRFRKVTFLFFSLVLLPTLTHMYNHPLTFAPPPPSPPSPLHFLSSVSPFSSPLPPLLRNVYESFMRVVHCLDFSSAYLALCPPPPPSLLSVSATSPPPPPPTPPTHLLLFFLSFLFLRLYDYIKCYIMFLLLFPIWTVMSRWREIGVSLSSIPG